MKKILITTSDWKKHFPTTDISDFEILEIDRYFSINRYAGELFLDQDDCEVPVTKTSYLVFFPFFLPSIEINGKLSYEHSVIDLIINYSDFHCADKFNSNAIQWVRSYEKSFLAILQKDTKLCVPHTSITNNPNRLRRSIGPESVVLKHGYGINRKIEGLSLNATLMSEDIDCSKLPVNYSYILQAYVDVAREIRVYGVARKYNKPKICLEMPTGNKSQIDWRTDLNSNDLCVDDIRHAEIEMVFDNLIEYSGLDYLCVDFALCRDDKAWVMDINPHGSWFWLPCPYKITLENWITEVVFRLNGAEHKYDRP